tara:strand:+ start:216 stop:488 length:273 start_codon:yes stop_codon:yes gene_type:complete
MRTPEHLQTLQTRQQSARVIAAQKKRIEQHNELQLKQTNTAKNNYKMATDSSTDKYMQQALKKVRENTTTIPNDLARFHGSAIYHPPVEK